MYWELDGVVYRVTFRLLNKLSYGNEKTDTSSQHIEPAEEAREKSPLKGRGGDNVLLLFILVLVNYFITVTTLPVSSTWLLFYRQRTMLLPFDTLFLSFSF